MDDKKPILSIETSGSLCGAAVYFNDEKYFCSTLQLKHAHAEKLFDVIDYVVKSAQIKLEQLEGVAVSSGPGSFTGLRIGMSAAKGIAFGASLPIISVPTFEAIALQLSHSLKDGTCFVLANKVNADEIYFAKFQIKGNNFIFVENLCIINHTDLLTKSVDCLTFGNAFGRADYNFSSPDPLFVAKWCRQNKGQNIFGDFDFLEPNYLKDFIIKEKKK